MPRKGAKPYLFGTYEAANYDELIDHPVEFLAVAVEAFFEMPQVVRQRHREVYAILSAYFGQDPAAWDDARGLGT